MGRTGLLVGIVGVMLLCNALVTDALGVEVRWVETSPARQVYLTQPWLVGTSIRLAGIFQVEVDMDDGNGPQLYDGFCIDLKQMISGHWKPYTLSAVEAAPLDDGSPYGPMGSAKANAIRELWGEHFDEIGGSSLNAAAFQVALWEIIYENAPNDPVNAWDAGAGRIHIDSSVDASIVEQANLWLGAIGDDEQDLDTTLIALTNYTSTMEFQDYLIDRGGGGTIIPEPLTIASVLLGVCGLGSYIRRRTLA